MPAFVLNTPARKAHPYDRLSTLAKGYVEAMFFTNGDTGDDRENLLNELGIERLTAKAVASIKADCSAFEGTIMPDGCFARQWIDRANEATGYDDEQAGRDFWFSRQGHGVGFWSRDENELPPELGEGLDKAAKAAGEAYVETWRGWIHHR